jgi:lipoprotein-anchoring transpeptidase ErfK/SrfK
MTDLSKPTRRLGGLMIVLAAAGCTTIAQQPVPATPPAPQFSALDLRRYGEVGGEPFHVPAVSLEDLQPRNLRQLVDYPTPHQPGTLIVDPANRFLFLVQEHGKALRYGVGVGREGLEFTGSATVQRKAQWPRWTPTQDMIKREPTRYAQWAGGMKGGDANPLGPGRSTCSKTAGTRSIGSTARTSPTPSARLYRRAASG